jgi:transcriptional regulator with XRE-family HTH domain
MAQPRTYNPVALRVAMARRRLTAPELAARIGKRSSKVQRFLMGINEPSEANLATIARALEWPVEFFYNTRIVWPSEMLS